MEKSLKFKLLRLIYFRKNLITKIVITKFKKLTKYLLYLLLT